MNRLTETQVSQLAPDPPSLKAGRELSNERKWLTLHYNDRALWGELQGSGKDPYRTQVDLQNIAFKCSCPSRKFPCKHGLGLLFIFAGKPDAVKSSDAEPEWVSSWIGKRAATAEKTARDTEPADVETLEKRAKDKAKRADERLSAVQAGAAELELLLRDLLRTGMLSVPEKGAEYYDKVVRRMIDAKAGGLANWVRNFNRINYVNGHAWQSEMLENAVKAWMLLEAFRRLDKLEPAVQEQIKSLVGWAQSKKELLENPDAEVLQDNWLVLGKKQEALDDQLNMLRIWLYGSQSGRSALLVEYTPVHLPSMPPVVPGTLVRAALAFYPSNHPYRAQIRQQGAVYNNVTLATPPLADWTEAQRQTAGQLVQSPWADDFPQYLAALSLLTDRDRWFLRDPDGALMEVDPRFGVENCWQLLAVSGGAPLPLFVLRTGSRVLPLGYMQQEAYFTF